MLEFCASILAADFARLGQDVGAAEAAGVDVFHIDVMDGHFVPTISFGPLVARALRGVTAKPLDVHLMVEVPQQFVPELGPPSASTVSRSTGRCPAGRTRRWRPSMRRGSRRAWCSTPRPRSRPPNLTCPCATRFC